MANGSRNPFAIVPKDLFALRLKDGTPLDAVDIAAFTALATFADADRYAFPSIDTLATMIQRNRRNTINRLRRLEEAGAITSKPRYDNSGRQTSNGYVLDLLKSTPRDVASDTPEDVASDMGEGVAGDTLTGPVRTEPKEQFVLVGAPETLSNDFECWYRLYPHKVGKAAARRAFASARNKTSLQTLIAGLHRYVRAKPPNREWCNPATWLNQERWLDEEAPATEPLRPSPVMQAFDEIDRAMNHEPAN